MAVTAPREIVAWLVSRLPDDWFDEQPSIRVDRLTVVVADGLAYEWYRYHVVDTPRDGGESATDTGNGVNIYRIDADGTWRVWRDTWATAS